MADRLLSLLGLSRRAGKLVLGHDPVCKAMKEKKARLVLVASDFSENSLKEIGKTAQNTNTALLTLDCEKEALSLAVGHHCGVVAVTDEGFSKKISALLEADVDQR